MSVVVRFAPSPTGFLHLGGLRTALYNYLFARKNQGTFLLRIEDTDQARFVPSSIENIIGVLKWAGITPDKGPFTETSVANYVQSKRLKIYKEKANQLLEEGLAYRCFCSKTRLELLRKEAIKNRNIPRYDNRCRHLSNNEINEKLAGGARFALRFKAESQNIDVDDLIYGKTPFDTDFSDFIIFKSDSFPTYHLANVVDDHLMEVSHVLRGEEWLLSTPKHLLIYKAFGWKPPQFAHIPLLLNEDGKKLSKRHYDLGVLNLKDHGYYPETIINYLMISGGGYTPKSSKLASLDELIEEFSLETIDRARCKVSIGKLKAFNRHAITIKLEEDREGFLSSLRDYLKKRFDESVLKDETDDNLIFLFTKSQGRYSSFGEFADELGFVWTRFEPSWYCEQFKTLGDIEKTIGGCLQLICKEWDASETRLDKLPFLKNYCTDNNLDYRTLMKFLRFCLVNSEIGLPVGQMLYILGKNEFSRRVRKGIEYTVNKLKEPTSINSKLNL